MKIVLIIGAAVFILGLALSVLAQIYPAFNGTAQVIQASFVNNGLPVYYGSLQMIWSLITFAGFIAALIGLVGIIVKAVKKKMATSI